MNIYILKDVKSEFGADIKHCEKEKAIYRLVIVVGNFRAQLHITSCCQQLSAFHAWQL